MDFSNTPNWGHSNFFADILTIVHFCMSFLCECRTTNLRLSDPNFMLIVDIRIFHGFSREFGGDDLQVLQTMAGEEGAVLKVPNAECARHGFLEYSQMPLGPVFVCLFLNENSKQPSTVINSNFQEDLNVSHFVRKLSD